MPPFFWIVVAVAVVGGMIGVSKWNRAVRRARLVEAPFPPAWEDILRRNVPLYPRMPAPLRRELQGNVNVFMDEKNFEGCGGLEMTDEIRVTIAAQACMLLLGRPSRYYPRLSSVLVYPHPCVVKSYERLGDHWVEGKQAVAGLSWTNTAVVLSWDHIRHAAGDLPAGWNVTVHEFAHQLDAEDGRADGVPVLERGSSYAAWARVMLDEFERLERNVKRGKRTFLAAYGATNHAEFFAVASEAFFERSSDLKARKPGLYAELKEYYRVDPAEW